MAEFRLSSIWCVPTPSGGVVLVMARYSDGRRGWTHLMRWRPGRSLEAGAWSSLQLKRDSVRLDPTGEFTRYSGSFRRCPEWNAPGPQQFRGSLGGGSAVSRTPWLSALTHIACGGYGGGGGPSVHALSPEEQARLWTLFEGGGAQTSWIETSQPGWRMVGAKSAEEGTWAWWESPWVGEQVLPGSDGALRVRLRKHATSFKGDKLSPRYSWRDARGVEHPMTGVAWAWLSPGGMMLLATHDGRLRSAKRREGAMPAGWESEWVVLEEHDCSVREPAPGPSPDWARADLGGRTGPRDGDQRPTRPTA